MNRKDNCNNNINIESNTFSHKKLKSKSKDGISKISIAVIGAIFTCFIMVFGVSYANFSSNNINNDFISASESKEVTNNDSSAKSESAPSFDSNSVQYGSNLSTNSLSDTIWANQESQSNSLGKFKPAIDFKNSEISSNDEYEHNINEANSDSKEDTKPADKRNPFQIIQNSINGENGQLWTVHFDSCGGSDVPEITDAQFGKDIDWPDDPSKTGFDFAGWYTSNTYETEWDFDNFIIDGTYGDQQTKTLTLYAKWEVQMLDIMASVNNDNYGFIQIEDNTPFVKNMLTVPYGTTYIIDPSTHVISFSKDGTDYGTFTPVEIGYTYFNLWNFGLNGSTENEITQDTEVVANFSEITLHYEVCIWGIGEDQYSDNPGDKCALTFGPAIGETNACLEVDNHTSHSDGKRCIHEDSWDEIIAHANELDSNGKNVYSECLEAGCTKSVPLKLNSTIGSMPTSNTKCSVLYDNINEIYRKWNYNKNNNFCDSANWAKSRIRATLNGYDNTWGGSFEPSSYAKNDDINDCLTKDNCLLSCFPSNLASAIKPKYYQVPTEWNTSSPFAITSSTFVTDKLWLMNTNETYGNSKAKYSDYGTQYSKPSNMGITYSNDSINRAYRESGYGGNRWLRSPSRDDRYSVGYVYGNGLLADDYVTFTYGLSPCFCLGTCDNHKATIDTNVGKLTSDIPSGWEKTNDTTYEKYFEKDTTYADILAEWDAATFEHSSDPQVYFFNGFTPQSGTLTDDVTFSAQWKNNCLLYQVCIWGIGEDQCGNNGSETANLTFGPAIGETNACLEVDNHTSHSDGKRCIHEDSWDEIIAHANELDSNGKNVYSECLEAGCTKSVPLELNSTIGTQPTSKTMCSVLYNTINESYRKWNNSRDTNNCESANWATSRMRATLNGANGGESDYAGKDCLSTSNCLLSCFPSKLANAIKPKYMQVATQWETSSSPYTITNSTYISDKLWLMNANETYGNSEAKYSDYGTQYLKPSNMGITYSNISINRAYRESGSSYNRWLRSPSRYYRYYAGYVFSGGNLTNATVGGTNGLSPCFCL